MNTTEIIEWLRRQLAMARNITRQETAKAIIEYYNGVHLDRLTDLLDDQFDKPEQMKLQLRIENLVEYIGDAISLVFDQPPILTSEDTAVQDWLLSLDPLLPLILKKAEVYKNLTRICAVHAWWDEQTQQIKHTILPSNVLFAEQDARDANKAITVVYMREILDDIGNPRIEYVHWDTDQCFLWTATDPVPRAPDPETNPGMENPYGIIPIAFYRDDVAGSNFFEDLDETILVAQDAVNIERTCKAYNLKMQGFSQPVLIGWDGKTPINVDPSRPILIPAGTADEKQGDFRFVSPDSHLEEIQGSIDEIRRNLADRYGIDPDAMKDGASGYALKLRSSKLQRRRKDDLSLSERFIRDLVEIDRMIWNRHNPGKAIGGSVPTSAIDFEKKYTVDFVEPTYEEDPEKVQRIDEKDIQMGVKTPADRLISLNPDLDEKEADAQITANMVKIQRWMGEKKRFGLSDLISRPERKEPVNGA